jgi:hypothetical protein
VSTRKARAERVGTAPSTRLARVHEPAATVWSQVRCRHRPQAEERPPLAIIAIHLCVDAREVIHSFAKCLARTAEVRGVFFLASEHHFLMRAANSRTKASAAHSRQIMAAAPAVAKTDQKITAK